MRPVSCPRAASQRRQPEQTVLYRTIATHLPAFLARTAGEDGTGGWPAFVRREFEAYLKCGVLTHGVLRVRCERCGDTTVVGFSCRGRGFCPSCGGRRMSELAAHVVERVLPRVPIRQWVFTVPVPVRYQLAFDAGLTRAVLRVCLRTVFGWQRRRAARRGLVGARSGSITAIQRFGGAANLNVHFHALLFDGVYTRASPTARPVFHRLPPPSDADIAALLVRVQRRVRRLLLRRGRWPDAAAGQDPFAAQAPRCAPAVAASRQGRVALGPRAGPPGRRRRAAADVVSTGRRSARLEGVSLHADVAVPARRRDPREKGCRFHRAPAARRGAVDRAHGRAAPLPVPTGVERRGDRAAPRSPGVVGALSRPRAPAAPAVAGRARAPRPPRPLESDDRADALAARRARARGGVLAATVALGPVAPARRRVRGARVGPRWRPPAHPGRGDRARRGAPRARRARARRGAAAGARRAGRLIPPSLTAPPRRPRSRLSADPAGRVLDLPRPLPRPLRADPTTR
jgi:hypothetical protein